MVRSVTRPSSQPLLKKAGSSDGISQPEECKSIRCSICCCLRTNYNVRYIFCTVAMIFCVYYKLNSIESTVANLRATASRFLFDFELQSSAFKDGAYIPSKYNSSLSPPLRWSHQPPLTQSFVLIVEDLDTTNLFKHWIIYNIPSTINELSEGKLVWPNGTVVLRNDYNRFRYDGPTPRDIQQHQHRYAFRLFALDVAKLELPSGTGRMASYDDLYTAMKPYILKEATLIGTYDATNHD